MKVTVRKARPADAATLAEYNRLMAEETEHRSLDAIVLRAGVDALLEDESKGLYYVAETAGGIVGQLMITYEWSDWRNGNFWWIQSVYVKREFRGKGVFQSLFEHVTSLAKQRSDICGLRLYVEENNTRAKKTYEGLGMKKTAYEMFEIEFVLGEKGISKS
ncbi:MAG: N-acetyltransferase [Bacteroidota bacterium]